MTARPAGLAVVALLALGSLGCETGPRPPIPAAAAPRLVCQGVPEPVCSQATDTTGAVTGTIAQILVRCTSPVCTVQQGEADVTVFFVDGRQEQSSYGWSSTAPAPVPVITQPPLPVQPVCVGVPLEKCLEMAATGPDGTGADGTISSIAVHCSGTRTPAGGQGQTTYGFVDGSPAKTVDWTYQGS